MARAFPPPARDEQPVYRDPTGGLIQLHAELLAQRRREVETVLPETRRILSRRIASAAAGEVAFAGMTAVLLWGAVSSVLWAFSPPTAVSRSLGVALLVVWAATAASYAIGRVVGWTRASGLLDAEMVATSDIHARISWLWRVRGGDISRALLERWEQRSVAWSLAGSALAVPLFLHYVLASIVTGGPMALASFGQWIGLSALLVGHCHYFVAHQGALFSRELRDRSGVRPPDGAPGWRALIVGVATSLMPGLAALGIPCVVVALTGLTFIPAWYWLLQQRIARERAAIDAWRDPSWRPA